MEDDLLEELRITKELLREAIEHLNYCNYGDSWERECSVELRKRLDAWEESNKEDQ